MRSSNSPRNRGSVSKAVATALPFDSALVRYAVCLCLAASASCALWALLVIQPATRSLTLGSSHLLDLERDFKAAESVNANLEQLTQQAEVSRARIFPDKDSVDQAIIALVEHVKSRGWNAVVAANDHDERPNELLSRSSYQLELSRESKADSSPELNELVTSQILAFLQSARSAPGALDIERLEILSQESRSTKAFLTLAAHIAKPK